MTAKTLEQIFKQHLPNGLPRLVSLGFHFSELERVYIGPALTHLIGRFKAQDIERNVIVRAAILPNGIGKIHLFIEHTNPTFDEFDYLSTSRMSVGQPLEGSFHDITRDFEDWLIKTDHEIGEIKRTYAIGLDWEPDQIQWGNLK